MIYFLKEMGFLYSLKPENMNDKEEKILFELEKELRKFIKVNPKLKHLLYDSFLDHRNRYRNDIKIFNKNFKGGKVLDIGANPFHLMYSLKRLGIEIVGVDINPDQFKKFIDKYNLSVKRCNIEIEKLPFSKNYFDFVVFNEVFEHLKINPIFTLLEINRVLKPGGTLLLTTPNLYALHKYFMFNFGLSFNDGYDQFEKIYTYGYVGHIREYSTKEIKKFLEKTGFKKESVTYQNHYSFFNYVGFNNIFIKLVGLLADILMKINPYWRRHQAIIAKKI